MYYTIYTTIVCKAKKKNKSKIDNIIHIFQHLNIDL